MARNKRLVQREISDWARRGLIDAETAGRLSADVDRRSAGFSISGVLIVMSALLFSAGLLILIASNWEAMPRLLRVGLVAAIILAANGCGAWAASLGRNYLADALWLIGLAAFGSGMALVGQMYHLSGNESGLYIIWWVAAVASALLLRSKALTSASMALACAWLFSLLGQDGFGHDGDLPWNMHAFVPMLAIGWAVSVWTRARYARDLALIALGLYIIVLSFNWGMVVALAWMPISAAAFVWATRAGKIEPEQFASRASVATHALLHFLLAATILHTQWHTGFPMAVVATAVIGGLIGALMLGGRDASTIRWLVYAAFAIELIFIHIQTVGTMLGTFGFLFLGAIALAAFARLVTKFERRAETNGREAA